jgi:hypothetical protein
MFDPTHVTEGTIRTAIRDARYAVIPTDGL